MSTKTPVVSLRPNEQQGMATKAAHCYVFISVALRCCELGDEAGNALLRVLTIADKRGFT